MKYKKKRYKRLKVAVIVICIIFTFMVLESKMRSMVINMAETKTKIAATQILNDSISKTLNSNERYSELVKIEKDQSNRISSISVDTIKANTLKADINNSTVSALSSDSIKKLSIPIGAFTGSTFLSGFGFNVPVKVLSGGNANINFESKLESAGFNQTKHTLYMNVVMDIAIYIRPYKTKSQLQTNIPISETVIVGEVPQIYANLNQASQEIISPTTQ